MTSLPTSLLEQLLSELSTLASVYHKPPESFVGKGRFGADEIQRAAIQEQRQNAAENPIAAAVSAAANGAPQSNVENLLDIDFDGAAPASADAAGAAGGGSSAADMMGLFDESPAPANGTSSPPPAGSGGMNDLMSSFGDMDLTAPPPPGMQLHGQPAPQKPSSGGGNDDLLGLF
jgi:AP-1 complex subunit beta-1